VSIGAETAGGAATRTAGRARFPTAAVLAIVLARSALLLAFGGRYGWQRDELYYALAGHHLQGGYVEFPPVTALLAWLSHALWGDWLTGLRAFPAAAGAGTVVVAALVARELGGSSRAQWMAAALGGLSPLMLSTNGLFQPVSFDQLATLLVLWLALRVCLGAGGWAGLGVAVGVGLETKYTLAVTLVALTAGLFAWRRELLRSPAAARAVVIALIIVLPNLLWEAQHHWVSAQFFASPPTSATDESRLGYVVDVLLLGNPLAVPVAVAGTLALWRMRPVRPLAAAIAGTVLLYLVLGGKSYYAGPVVVFALAAGAPSLDRWARSHRVLPWALGFAYAALLLVALPTLVPVLPRGTAIRNGTIAGRSDYKDELGWPALAASAARAVDGAQVVIAQNYGEAGALALYGKGLPPLASPDVTLRFWRPRVSGRQALLVGYEAAEAPFCEDYRVAARIAMPVENQERGRPIARCVLRASLASVWPTVVAGAPL